ncbi:MULTISPECIES: hypothetical protein [Clostridium]|uniref:Uncharacterized protein n=1 Tax=Clostridium frigoriphilum TaxID=443253 RepID=A0ABU7UWP3_9CLOT|nr:hypothetical protein [Clostridium sp. DSM 17811]MBU3102247.1 hypothetical protein [Clostridium sp. DSM 17811]
MEYFNKKSNPAFKFEQYQKPNNLKEFVKVAYDVLWNNKINTRNIINYAAWTLYPTTKWINEIIILGTNDISKPLIDYIDLELTKSINKEKNEPFLNQQTFNIQNAHESIIGSQTNATINTGITFDEAIKYILKVRTLMQQISYN